MQDKYDFWLIVNAFERLSGVSKSIGTTMENNSKNKKSISSNSFTFSKCWSLVTKQARTNSNAIQIKPNNSCAVCNKTRQLKIFIFV